MQLPRLTREEVQDMLAQGEKDFRGYDLSCLDLSKLDFTGVDFGSSDLTGTNLDCAKLVGIRTTGDTIVRARGIRYAEIRGVAISSTAICNAQDKAIDTYLNQGDRIISYQTILNAHTILHARTHCLDHPTDEVPELATV